MNWKFLSLCFCVSTVFKTLTNLALPAFDVRGTERTQIDQKQTTKNVYLLLYSPCVTDENVSLIAQS